MAKDFAIKFYGSSLWRKGRVAYLISVDYLCERCNEPAKIVHHIKKLTIHNINNPFITLNWDNLEAVCQECHNIEHRKKSVTADGLYFNEYGDLVPKKQGAIPPIF